MFHRGEATFCIREVAFRASEAMRDDCRVGFNGCKVRFDGGLVRCADRPVCDMRRRRTDFFLYTGFRRVECISEQIVIV